MPAGGRRPGAGRPRASKTALQAAVKPAATPNNVVPDIEDPGYILGLVARGEVKLPDGRKITPEMRIAARELLPYYKAKLATTTERKERNRPVREYSTAELEAMLEVNERDLAAANGAVGDTARVDPAPEGARELPDVV
jgi:hypothetical protein